jgi:hypothetical protein
MLAGWIPTEAAGIMLGILDCIAGGTGLIWLVGARPLLTESCPLDANALKLSKNAVPDEIKEQRKVCVLPKRKVILHH